ncbi:NADP-dependent oxidoreductase [Mycobacterium sp. KBS0706]|uniref:NADP-dependent oxidoreductase n=1 Tax=Mycobacterium sp. KBS0706 TaxID=2578109 RepID=UPI00110FB73D|nr:NADP-dependent oxidoreductase [Mycobacterium sp. KBS0706]TSD85165.1 NADP-dependent oxidoreductase [Mycobacterium sp. KBS0706]
MKAARIHAYGDLGNAAVEEVPVPEVGPDEVLIRVAAASVNPLDVKLIGGGLDTYFPLAFPYALGTDLAGTVERAGPLAARWRPGDRVIARADPVRGGAFAEFAVVPAARIAAAPATLPPAAAAGLPTAAGTAWQALFETAHLRAAQTVLIHAGAGGVGSAAVQLARIAGARVAATASGANADLLRRLGAGQVIDYRTEDFAAAVRDVDVVLDTVGGETQQRSFAVLRPGGVLASIVSPPDEALAQAHGVSATFVFHQTDATRLGLVAGLCDAGSLTVVMDRELALGGLAVALDHVASGHTRGKVLLRPA